MSVNFDRIAHRYDETRGGPARGQVAADAISAFLPKTGIHLEIGVGTGLVAQALGREVVGIDISAEMLARAQQRALSRLVRGDGGHLPFDNGVFSGAYMVWVFHLVADQEAVVREAGRVLRRSAPLVIRPAARFPAGNDPIQQILDPLFGALRPRRDAPDQIAAVAASAGFEVVEIVEVHSTFEDSPAQVAAAIEARTGAAFWNVPEQTWQRVVEPALAALRALPRPDSPRVRRMVEPTVVLRRERRPHRLTE